MKTIGTHLFAAGGLAILAAGSLLHDDVSARAILPAASRQLTCPNYPDTVFLGDYPNDSYGWTDNVQGIAHDASNWFFTTQSDPFLIKLPVGFDLTSDFDPEDSDTWPAGALAIEMPQSLQDAGYEDFKDLDQAKGFLFVPVAGEDPDTEEGIAGIAVFTTSNLTYLGFHQITEIPHASFVAFNMNTDRIYISRPTVSQDEPLRKYKVNFAMLESSVENAITPDGTFALAEVDGPLDPPLGNLQGGAFTPWGDLYLVNGLDNPPSSDNGGVHLFNAQGILIDESTNGGGTFNFEYDPSATFPNFEEGQEPEGADWWNLEGGSAPGIGGQLHVIRLQNWELAEDDLFVKHYAVDYSCIANEDQDGDGLTNGEEIYTTNTAPKKSDTDDDQLSDGVELKVLGTDPLDPDSDDDSIPDGDEDADQDGLSNANEVNVHHTDPTKWDTDGDLLSDGDEVNAYGTNPLVKDTDGDGLTDGEEVLTYHTDPLVGDTDEDGLNDGDEVHVYGTDPNDADTDDDLLNDGVEVKYATNPLDKDTDDDGLLDGQDVEFIQNAVSKLPLSSFQPPGQGTRNAILSLLDAIETRLLAGAVNGAISRLELLRTHVDGCGAAADGTDWIRACTDQIEIRVLIDLLVANVTP